MLEIQSIADIPFRERDPWSLLNLDSEAASGVPYPDDDLPDEELGEPDGEPDGAIDAEPDEWDEGDPGLGPDLTYYGFGFARVDQVWLTSEGDPEPLPPVRDALLLALHTPDDVEPLDRDILLEFWIDDVTCEEADEDDDYAVTVKLSRFLELWLPRISRDESAIVLAVCNPHKTRIELPAMPGVKPIWYPLGDVTSWRDAPADLLAGPGILRLSADAWLRA